MNDRTGCLARDQLHLDLSGALHTERAVDLVLEALVDRPHDDIAILVVQAGPQ